MPLYQYQCVRCQTLFEVSASLQEKEAGIQPACPSCQSIETHQVLDDGTVLHCMGEFIHTRTQVVVNIIGAPVACKEGVKDIWREMAAWAAGQLTARFGERVQVCYYDLFDADCPAIPPQVHLPLVLVNGELLSSGGKISVPAIRRKIEAITA